MPAPETVTVPTDAIVEAYAQLDSMVGVWVALADGTENGLSEACEIAAVRLMEAAFGEDCLRGDRADPIVVMAEARSAEATADFLDILGSRGVTYRSYARRVREAGTTAVPFEAAASEAADARGGQS